MNNNRRRTFRPRSQKIILEEGMDQLILAMEIILTIAETTLPEMDL